MTELPSEPNLPNDLPTMVKMAVADVLKYARTYTGIVKESNNSGKDVMILSVFVPGLDGDDEINQDKWRIAYPSAIQNNRLTPKVGDSVRVRFPNLDPDAMEYIGLDFFEYTFLKTGADLQVLFEYGPYSLAFDTQLNKIISAFSGSTISHSASELLAEIGAGSFSLKTNESKQKIGTSENTQTATSYEIKTAGGTTEKMVLGETFKGKIDDLIDQIDTLITTIQAITVASAPIDNIPAFIPIKTAIATIKSNLGTALSLLNKNN